MDNKGRVTVVLHWDQRHCRGSNNGGMDASPSKKTTHPQTTNGFGVGGLLMENSGLSRRESDLLYQQHLQTVPAAFRHGSTPQITVIHHDNMPAQMTDRLSKYC